jgi:hypothetical protein
LGQTLTSDSGGGGKGSKALGEVHNEVRLDKTIGDLKLVRPSVQNYIDALRMLNFPSSTPVKLVYAIDRGLESGRANRDSTLSNSWSDRKLSDEYYMREYGFKKGDIVPMEPKGGKQSPEDQKKKNEEASENQNTNAGDEKNDANSRNDDDED